MLPVPFQSAIPVCCPPLVPEPRIATGAGGWAIGLAFVDAAGNPLDLSAGSLTPYAEFYQPNLSRTTVLTVANGGLLITAASSGEVVALIPQAIKLSLLVAPSPQVLRANPAAPTLYPYLHAYCLDSQGSAQGECFGAYQPIDPRVSPLATIPTPAILTGQVGAAGAQGEQGDPGLQGIPGGIIPHSATAASGISASQVLTAVAGGEVEPSSSADPTQAGSVVGIATAAASTGQSVTYQDGGTITNAAWNWLPGPIFFDNFGQLTQTAPSGGFVQSVGRMLTPTSIAVQLGDAVVLAS